MIKLIFAERHTRLHFIVFDAMAGLSLPEKKKPNLKSKLAVKTSTQHLMFSRQWQPVKGQQKQGPKTSSL